jgi:hypothetical protein
MGGLCYGCDSESAVKKCPAPPECLRYARNRAQGQCRRVNQQGLGRDVVVVFCCLLCCAVLCWLCLLVCVQCVLVLLAVVWALPGV